MRLNFKKVVGIVMATIAIGVALAGWTFAEGRGWTLDRVAVEYGAKAEKDYVPKDFVMPKYEDLTKEQKVVYDKIQNREWYSTTFIDKDNKFFTLVDYWKKYDMKPVKDYIDYPTIRFDGFHHFWIGGDTVEMSVWQFDGASTTFKIISNIDGTTCVSKVNYDFDKQCIYIQDEESWPDPIKTVYYSDPDDYMEIAKKAIVGSWRGTAFCVDGKVVAYNEYLKAIGKADGIDTVEDSWAKGRLVTEFREDGTVKTLVGGKLMTMGKYTFNKDGYIVVDNKGDKVVFNYDVEMDVLVRMPENLEQSDMLLLSREKYMGASDVTNEEVAGKWWIGFETYGKDFNDFGYYYKLDRYFGTNCVAESGGYEFQLNEDGTGYFLMTPDAEKDEFNYTIENFGNSQIAKKIVFTHVKDGLVEECVYDTQLDQIHYMGVNGESDFCAYVRKKVTDDINLESLQAKYNVTKTVSCIPKDFIMPKYTDLTDAQKNIFDKLQKNEWYGATHLKDGELISLGRHYKAVDVKSKGDFLNYPSIFFSSFKFYYVIADYMEEYAWQFDGDTTDIIYHWELNGEKGASKMFYDEDIDAICSSYESKETGRLQSIYYRAKDNEVEMAKNNAIGLWMFTNFMKDGKIVTLDEFHSGFGKMDKKAEFFMEIKADGTTAFSNGEKVVCKGTWTIDDEAFIHIYDELGGMVVMYDYYYDIMVTLPGSEDDDKWIMMARAKDVKFADAKIEDFAGVWEIEYDSYGQDYNNYECYTKMQKYFDVDTYAKQYNGYELCLNVDGTGYYIMDEGDEKYTFTYVLRDGYFIDVAYDDSEFKETFIYDTRVGKIEYVPFWQPEGNDALICYTMYRRK